MKSQRRTGIVLSYINFAISIIGNLVLTPVLMHLLGDEQYGLYQVMRSFGGTLLMFNLGVSSMVARSIARRQAGEKDGQNTLAIGIGLSAGLALLVGAAAMVIHACIPAFYQGRYDAQQLKLAQNMFGLFAAASVCHILTDAFAGCLIGHEHFAANSLIITLKYGIRFGLLFACIQRGAAADVIAGVDLLVGAAALVCLAGYSLIVLRERVVWTRAAPGEIRRMASFSVAVLLQAIVTQLNTHMDPILLGRFADTVNVVAMYTCALTIYQMYHELISVFGHYYLARASRMVAQNATGRELTDLVIHPGQFQAAIALGMIMGFALFGRRFITLWIGKAYQDAYGIALILMIPALIPLVQSTAVSILDAKFSRMYRSVVLLAAVAVNVLLSIVLIQWIGHWGAAIGTAFSVLVGHGWMMNRYYARHIGLEVGRMFRRIFQPVLLPAAAASLLCMPLLLFPCTWLVFFGQCLCFVVMYAILLVYCNRLRKQVQST